MQSLTSTSLDLSFTDLLFNARQQQTAVLGLLQLRKRQIKGLAQELGVRLGDAHGRLDAEDVAVQAALANEHAQIAQPLHHLNGQTHKACANSDYANHSIENS